MKITDRIALLKAGYTKEDITAMIEEEKNQEDLKPDLHEEKLNNDYAEVLVNLASEVKSLKETMQATNRNNVDQLAPNTSRVEEAKKILEGLINPITDEKEE